MMAALSFYLAVRSKKLNIPDGYVLISKTPPEELLISMAVRDDHGLGCPGYYDQAIFSGDGITHARRMEIRIADMRKVYEEVAGEGFYKPEYADRYRAMKGS